MERHFSNSNLATEKASAVGIFDAIYAELSSAIKTRLETVHDRYFLLITADASRRGRVFGGKASPNRRTMTD